MYRPGTDVPQFRPVPVVPPPSGIMGGPFVSPPPPIPPPIHPPTQGRPHVMHQYTFPPLAPQPPSPLLVPPSASLRASLLPMQPSLPSVRPSILPSPSARPSLPILQPSLPPLQSSFPSLQPSLPSLRPPLPQFQPSLPSVHPSLPLVLPPVPSIQPAPFLPPVPSIQPAPFLPPLPLSPPSENPPPPPPPSPPPEPPPLPNLEESSSAADLLPPEPPKPNDPEMLKNIDVLAAFVVKNGPRFESMARARQAGDPKFAFLFESDAAPEAAIGHAFYKWKKQILALELGLETENKASNQVDSGTSAGRVQHTKVMSSQPPLPNKIPESPAMSDMDMEDDFAPSPLEREPIGQLEVVSSEAEEHLCSKTPPIECVNAQETSAIERFGNVPHTQDHATFFNGNLKRSSQGGTSWTSTLLCDVNVNREDPFPGLLKGNSETLLSCPADAVRESREKAPMSNLINTNEHRQKGGHTGSILDGDWEPSESLQRMSDHSSEMTEQDCQREVKMADVSQEKHVPSEFLSGSFEHSSVNQVTHAHRDHRVRRLSRWGSMPLSCPLKTVKESGDHDKPSPSVFLEDGSRQKSNESASPRHDTSFSDFGDTSKDVQRLTSIDKAGGGSSENGRSAADGHQQQSQEAVSVDEFGRLVRKGARESDSEEERLLLKRRRSYNRSRSRSRSGSGRGSGSRSRSQSHSSGESSWRRRSFSPPPFRRGRWSRSHSRSPRWRRSYSRSPPRDMRWGGMGRGERDWRVEREPSGRGRRGGRGSGPNLCFHHARGRCFRGNACRFLHPDREIGQERGMHLKEFQAERPEAGGLIDVEGSRGAYIARKPEIEGDPYLDLIHWNKEGDEAQGSVPDRERLAALKAVDMGQFNGVRDQAGELAPDGESPASLHAFSQVSNIRKRAVVENLNIYGATELSGEPYVIRGKEEVKKSAAGGEMQSVGDVEMVEEPDINKKLELGGNSNTSREMAAADKCDSGATTQVDGESENCERLEVCDSTEKDLSGNLDYCGDFGLVEKLPTSGGAQMVGESELDSEADAKGIGVERKDSSSEVSAANKLEMPSEIEVYEKANVRANIERSELLPEAKLPEKLVTVKKPDLSSQAEVTQKLEESTRRGSAENAMNNPGVGGEPQGQANGNGALRQPMVPGVPLLGVSFSPVLPFTQTNSTGQSISKASSSTHHQYVSSEQRYAPVFSHQHPNTLQNPLPARNMPYTQSNPLRPPVIPAGTFNPPHPLSGQQSSLMNGNAGPRQSFPVNNPSPRQQVFIPRASMHGPPYVPHNHPPPIQPSNGASFPSQPGFTQNITQQSVLPPQDQLRNQPVQFPSNPSIPQQHGIPSYPAKVFQSGQHGLSANISLSREDSSYSQSFNGDTAKQYLHPSLMSDGLQHAYARPTITSSAASTHNAIPWMDSTSLNSLAASMSVLPSTTECPPSYSYSLTTIPPLSNLIKLPGGSNLPTSGDQYDPLSDVLDPGPSGALKSMSSKPLGDGRSVGVGLLENVSPGLDTAKANILAHKSEVDNANMNEAAADVGVVENVSPLGDWSPVQPGDEAEVGHDQAQAKSKKSSRGLKLLRAAVADRVKELLKPTWREGHMSKEAFKTIAKKAVEKVTGNLPSHHIPKSQEKVDQFMAVSSSKISKLVQGYVDKYLKL